MSAVIKSRPLSTVRAEIVDASLGRDHRLLERLLEEGVGHPRGRLEFLPPLARLREEQGRPDEASPLWQDMFAARPDPESALHVLRRERDKAGAARDWLEGKASGGDVRLDDVIALPSTPPEKSSRHIAICGVSYCGSTVLGRLLDGLDGVHDIGESHWLIEQRALVDGSRQIDFLATDLPPSTLFCRQCGEACPVLDRTFRFGLQADRRAWYDRIAARVGTDLLVSSDKNLTKYTDLDPSLRFDAIVLFKSPVDAWHSFRKRLAANGKADQQASLDAFIASWTRQYGDALKLQPEGQKLFLHFGRLAAEPQETLMRLVEILDLPKPRPGETGLSVGQHAIGGNDGFFGQQDGSEAPAFRRMEAAAMPDEHRRRIEDDPEIARIHETMLSQSEARFGRS